MLEMDDQHTTPQSSSAVQNKRNKNNEGVENTKNERKKKKEKFGDMLRAGIEPAFSRPQREVMTTIRSEQSAVVRASLTSSLVTTQRLVCRKTLVDVADLEPMGRISLYPVLISDCLRFVCFLFSPSPNYLLPVSAT